MIGLSVGLFNNFDDIKNHKENERIFTPSMDRDQRNILKDGWKQAMDKVLY